MKKHLNNQGYTMVMVLLSIVLISLLAMMLIPKSVNTALQVNRSEEMTQTKDLAEMGVTHAHALIQSQVNATIKEVKNLNRPLSEHDNLFCNRIQTNLRALSFFRPLNPTSETITIQNVNYKYKLDSNGPFTLKSGNNTTCDGFNNITIPIKSTGIVGGKEKVVTAAFTISNGNSAGISQEQRDSNGQVVPVDPSTLPLITRNSLSISGSSGSTFFESSPRFLNTVDIRGSATLSIAGNAWFEGIIDFRGGSGKLLISGDAYFSRGIDQGGSGNYICVRGNAFEKKDGVFKPIAQNIIDSKCPAQIYESVKFAYDINEWGIFDIDVNY
ncbi:MULTISPECIES: hypothetical protein [Bacillus]|uniref:hypothetical protein n=1 Tax=Bacillus TaxID=1386 RepID=UPI000BB8B5A6|nr:MULTISPECIES: hypothetical protein [Bacillus]